MKTVSLVALSLVGLAASVVSSAHARTFLRALDNPNPQAVSESSPSASPAACVMPWAIIGDPSLRPPVDYWGLAQQQLFIGAFGPSASFWPVALYGNGALDYKQAIVTPCGSGDRGACDQEDPRVRVGETLQCDAKAGNIGQITDDALTRRYGGGSNCDALTHEQAVTLAETEPCKDRTVFVPIVDAWPPAGQVGGPMHILDIATFYIAAWDRSPPYGDLDLNGDTLPDRAMVWGYFVGFEVAGRPTPVDIDIRPGSYPNSINLKSRGVIPVALLSTEDFDASTVDAVTVVFAGASQIHHAVEDLDRDGDDDLILHFKTQETNLASGDTEACLTGQTRDGMPIQGCDSVRTVP